MTMTQTNFLARYKITIIIALLVLVGLVWFLLPEEEESTATGYSISKIKKGAIQSTVSATGVLSPLVTVQVGSQVSGTISKLHVDFNSHVKKDQVIAEIEPSVFKARLAEAQASVLSATAERNKAKVTLADAKRNLARQQRLRKQNLVSVSTLDAAKLAFEQSEVDLQIKEAALTKAIAVRDREKVNLDYTKIVSPIDGVVISRDVDAGQTVVANLSEPVIK